MSGRLWLDRRLMEDVFADSAKPQAGDTLETPDDLSGAILRSLSANVAVLDRRGVVIAVNEPWRRRWRVRGPEEAEIITAGVDYLEMLTASARGGGHRAAEALTGVEAVCVGEQASFELDPDAVLLVGDEEEAPPVVADRINAAFEIDEPSPLPD